MKHNYHVGKISIQATLHQTMTIQAEHDGNHNRHYQQRVGDAETLRNSNGHWLSDVHYICVMFLFPTFDMSSNITDLNQDN